jgi:hypothetical protein
MKAKRLLALLERQPLSYKWFADQARTGGWSRRATRH